MNTRALAHICQYVRENIDLESDLVELTLRHLLLNLLDSNINTPTNANPSGRAARVSHYRARVCEETSLARCDSGARGREAGTSALRSGSHQRHHRSATNHRAT